MGDYHQLGLTSSPGGLLFTCEDGCGRRLVVDRVSGALTIIDHGDQYVAHRGAHSDLDLAVPAITGGWPAG